MGYVARGGAFECPRIYRTNMYNGNTLSLGKIVVYDFCGVTQEMEVIGSVQSILHQKVNEAFDQIWSVQLFWHACTMYMHVHIQDVHVVHVHVYTCIYNVHVHVCVSSVYVHVHVHVNCIPANSP